MQSASHEWIYPCEVTAVKDSSAFGQPDMIKQRLKEKYL